MARTTATKGPRASAGSNKSPILGPKKKSREMTMFELELEASKARQRKRKQK